MSDDHDAYSNLTFYTLSHAGSNFIHQHVVDAFAAQHADRNSKPVTVTFSLIGLYLHVERNLSGREVQRVHMRLASERRQWPHFEQPNERGAITVHEVMAAPPGPERDAMVSRWCSSVWDCWKDQRERVLELLGD